MGFLFSNDLKNECFCGYFCGCGVFIFDLEFNSEDCQHKDQKVFLSNPTALVASQHNPHIEQQSPFLQIMRQLQIVDILNQPRFLHNQAHLIEVHYVPVLEYIHHYCIKRF